MNIGIDARPLQGETKYRGIGKSLELLLSSISDLNSNDNNYIFYLDEGLPAPKIIKKFNNSHIVKIPTSRLGRVRYVRSVVSWYRPIRPKKDDIDVLLQYDSALGIPKNIPTVSVFHDLIPLLFKDEGGEQKVSRIRRVKNEVAGYLYWKKYLQALGQYKNSSRIIAISHASKNDFIKYFPEINEEKISVINHGSGQNGKGINLPSNEVKKLSEAPYLLYVGGIDLRKNIVGLLKDFYSLKEKNSKLNLITAGKEFSLTDQLDDLGWQQILINKPVYAKDVLSTGFVSDSDLAYLYANAVAFVFPSRYEGFGLPILEAMQAGCPVIAYNNSSIPEVAGDAALLVEDGESMVPAIQKLIDSPSLRTSLIAKGKKQARKFSWEKTARETLRVLEEAGN